MLAQILKIINKWCDAISIQIQKIWDKTFQNKTNSSADIQRGCRESSILMFVFQFSYLIFEFYGMVLIKQISDDKKRLLIR